MPTIGHLMWKLNPPDVALVNSQLSSALTLVNGEAVYAISAAERVAVLNVYSTYDELAGRPAPALLPNLDPACTVAMENAYGQVQVGGRLRDLRSTLLLAAESCPFCGFGEIRDLDHYLPKSVYRCLSIYPRNLIPCCSACNNAKRTHVPEAESHSLVHAYYAQFPAADFLTASVSQPDTALNVTFAIDPTHLDPDLYVSLMFQLQRLKLNRRYRSQVNSYLFGQRSAMREAFISGGTPLLSYFLERSAAALANDFGRNDWRPALFKGLLACDPFLNGGIMRYFGEREQIGA